MRLIQHVFVSELFKEFVQKRWFIQDKNQLVCSELTMFVWIRWQSDKRQRVQRQRN